MTVLIREGSVSKDLHALAPILGLDTSAFLALCTDDRNPLDIAEEGHLDYMIRTLIGLGCAPLAVYRAASLTGARAFGLSDRGLSRRDAAPTSSCSTISKPARSPTSSPADASFADALFAGRGSVAPVGLDSVKARARRRRGFRRRRRCARDLRDRHRFRARSSPTHLRLRAAVARRRPARRSRRRTSAKVAVVARHGINRNIGRGFVKGFGLKRGAIASSVGHDSHNICVVGADDADMAAAVNRLIDTARAASVVVCGRRGSRASSRCRSPA